MLKNGNGCQSRSYMGRKPYCQTHNPKWNGVWELSHEQGTDGVGMESGTSWGKAWLQSAMSCTMRRAPCLSFRARRADLSQPHGIDVEVPNDAETAWVSTGDVLNNCAENSRGVGVKNISESRNDGNLVDIWTAVYGTSCLTWACKSVNQ